MDRNTVTGRIESSRGFTFIEMVMVIVVMGILLGIAIPVYQAQVRTSKESVLKHNLAILRERIDPHGLRRLETRQGRPEALRALEALSR